MEAITYRPFTAADAEPVQALAREALLEGGDAEEAFGPYKAAYPLKEEQWTNPLQKTLLLDADARESV